MSRKKAFVGSVNICYESIGEGFPLIAITGKDGNMDWWNPSIKAALSERYRLILLDNRGTGRSEPQTEEYSIADMARDVVGLMDVLEIGKAHVFGQSLGGMVAQEIAIEYPERVEKLVLCATTCGVRRVRPSFRMVRWMLRAPTVFSPQDTLRMLYSDEYIRNNSVLTSALVKRMLLSPPDPINMGFQKKATKKFESYQRLNRITSPTLILHGEDDWVFSPKHAEILNRRIASSEMIVYPQAGHGVFTQEHRKILEEMHLFLSGENPS